MKPISISQFAKTFKERIKSNVRKGKRNEMAKFKQFTRAYKSGKTIKTGTYHVDANEIAAVRASNRLGKANHRSTITLRSGTEVNLKNRSSEVKKALNIKS